MNLGLYYRSDRTLTIGKLRQLAQGLDDRHLPDLVTKTGERVPWINGGCWLRAEGRPVDWLYRGAGKVATTIERGVSGQTACHYRPDRPTAFTSTSTSGRSTAAARSTTPRACYGNSSRRPRSTRPSSSARSSRSTHGRPDSPSRSPASRQQGAGLPRLGYLFRGVLHSADPLRCQ